ncbi:hypothetical protein PFY12_01640 [Chryseobacterium camelliae]|uniref:DUF4468 domain-containing protein n=1 Tax=Chryseobacterium camelliae TaxID=1265445 RepID=A0ABY7QMF5_9FLAO|nr:hypothetical protein [Chryseobacterium camelliae]WBV60835.1 hypothetical protein PFY12_01640 [Chryseobacterium camelliae]
MKKLFLLFAFIACGFTATAQTKEETINWIKEKLAKYFEDKSYKRGCKIGCSYTFHNVEINECEIKYKVEYWWGFSGGTTEGYNFILPTQDLKINNEGEFVLNYENIEKIQTSSTFHSKHGEALDKPKHISGTQYEFGINIRGEVDLVNRIQKAITHLASFCPPKEKETF